MMKKLKRENFSISEMTESSFAERLGIDNTPSLKAMANLGLTVNSLEQVRALLGHPMHVNSAYRSESLERVLSQHDYPAWCRHMGLSEGSTSWKKYFSEKHHARGYAADFTCAQYGAPREIVQTIAASSIPFDQCVLEGSWVHISFAPTLRRQIFSRRFDHQGISSTTAPVNGAAVETSNDGFQDTHLPQSLDVNISSRFSH